jgi:uncharacterized protein YndB with AHSA1/START domain
MQRTVEVDMVINASPEKVFEAWTNPVELATWWGAEESYHMTKCDLDPTPGGQWAAHGVFHSNNAPFTISGEYLTIDRPFNLAFTWNQSWTPGVMTMVDFTFMTDLNGTLIKVRHLSDPNEEAADGHRKGWQEVLSWLKAHLEPKPASTAVVEQDFDLDAIAARFASRSD